MEFYISRACQIATMDQDLIEKLHERELKIKHYIPNWNIQELFHLNTIKETFGIPEDDNEAQARYRMRIESALKSQGLTRTESGQFPYGSSLDPIHEFDWAVFNNRDKIPFYFSTKEKSERLLDRLGKAIAILVPTITLWRKFL